MEYAGEEGRIELAGLASLMEIFFSKPNARCISPKCTLHLSQQHVAFE